MKFKAFTLVELMVVMAIIAFLSVGAYGGLTYALRQGRDTQRMRITDQIQTALVAYYADWASYPGCTGISTGISVDSKTIFTCSGAFSDAATSFVKTTADGSYSNGEGLKDYFESEFAWGPFSSTDTDSRLKYYWLPAGSGTNGAATSFTICTTLENKNGGNVKNNANIPVGRGCYCVGANQSVVACKGMQ